MRRASVPAEARAERVVVLDLGSNAARFLLARLRPGVGFSVLRQARVATRLGAGSGPALSQAAIRQTLRATRDFLGEVGVHRGARIIAVATAAVRDASNAELLLGPLRQVGADVRVLSGEEEARLGALAAVSAGALDDGLVIDLGGGSLQLTRILDRDPRPIASLPLGVVRLTARFLRHAPPTPSEVAALGREVSAWLTDVLPPAADAGPLVGLGGTIRALARIHAAADAKRSSRPRPWLSRDAVARMRRRLEPLSPGRLRRVAGLKAERADIIVAGALVVEQLMDLGGYERLRVCPLGVRHGVLILETFGRAHA